MSQTLPNSGLLTSWKEIANFMGKGVRTVQRWEATLGLPVIRPVEGRAGIVMARPSDLEAWVLKGRRRAAESTEQWQQKDDATRAVFSECIRELLGYNAQVKALCREMVESRQKLQQEVARMKSLCQQWDAIRQWRADATAPQAAAQAAPKAN